MYKSFFSLFIMAFKGYMTVLEFYAVAGLIWTLVFNFQQKKARTAAAVPA